MLIKNFRTLVRLVVLYLDGWDGWFFLARRSFVCAKSDVGKFKITVGAADANGLKCSGFWRVGRARGYPNLIQDGNGLTKLVFSGHVDHQFSRINSPPCVCVFAIYKMPSP